MSFELNCFRHHDCQESAASQKIGWPLLAYAQLEPRGSHHPVETGDSNLVDCPLLAKPDCWCFKKGAKPRAYLRDLY